jgi:hypothetical protein
MLQKKKQYQRCEVLKNKLVLKALIIELPNILTNSVAPEPEGSSPHSQEPANNPYPEPGESTPHPPNQYP